MNGYELHLRASRFAQDWEATEAVIPREARRGREIGSCGLLGAPSTEGASVSGAKHDLKASDLKQLQAELADGFTFVPVPRRPGRWYVEGPGGWKVEANGHPLVVGRAAGAGSVSLLRKRLAAAGALR